MNLSTVEYAKAVDNDSEYGVAVYGVAVYGGTVTSAETTMPDISTFEVFASPAISTVNVGPFVNVSTKEL